MENHGETKRVLILADAPYVGGITSHILSLCDAFAGRDDFDIVLATLPGRRDDATLLEGARDRGFACRVIPMACAWDVRVLRHIHRLVREEGIALVHTHNYRATLLCAAAVRGVPVVNTCHGPVVEPSARLRAWQRAELYAMRRHRLTIACAEHVRAWLIDQGLDEARLRTAYNGCAPREARGFSVSRQTLGIAPGCLVALYVGRLVEGKGLEHLIKALAGLHGATALIAGDGPLRPRLDALARQQGADVRFVGKTSDPAPYYRLADAVVLPSRMEALPMTLIEAAAYGRPAIATRAGGIPEVVAEGETGILVDYGNAAQLREALERCREAALREAMGHCARERWRKTFSLERMAEGLAALYREALTPRPEPRAQR